MIEVEIKLPIASPADLEVIRAELLKIGFAESRRLENTIPILTTAGERYELADRRCGFGKRKTASPEQSGRRSILRERSWIRRR